MTYNPLPLLEPLQQLVTQVGSYQVSAFRKHPPGWGSEKDVREYVSEVDIHSEELLKEGLQKLLPEAGFYGEETGQQGNDKLRWIIDPLDGTTNFLSGLEQFSISVALEDNHQGQVGIVYRPVSCESFSAVRGYGLYHNGKHSTSVPASCLRQALIGTGFPYRSPDLAKAFFPCAEEVLYRCRGLRRFGSAALDLSYVAAGFLQGFWESDLQPYDVAAALLFLKESGCPATNIEGQLYSPYRDRILICGQATVHQELLQIVTNHYK